MLDFSIIPQKAPCEYFNQCGGCGLQEIENHAEYKFNSFKNNIKKIDFNGLLQPLKQISVNSRRRVNFKVHNNKLSLNQHKSRQLINIFKCLLLEDPINILIMPINNLIKKLKIKIDMVNIMNSDTGIELLLFSQERSDLDADILIAEFAKLNKISRVAWQVKSSLPSSIIELGPIQLRFNDRYIDLPINSFLQVSKESSKIMTDIILDNLNKSKKILELYCGSGSFTIPISSKGSVTAIEGCSSALGALDKAAKRHLLPIKVIKQDLYQNPLRANDLNDYSQIVINPPRNGSTPQFKEIAKTKKVQKVILISCSLDSFTRDSAILINNGFSLNQIHPIDQFIYSNHIEAIGIFEKSNLKP